jgi:hypothetical protein
MTSGTVLAHQYHNFNSWALEDDVPEDDYELHMGLKELPEFM